MIDWLVQTASDLPALSAEAWLSPPERERLATLRVEKRRREWLLGRWTAKRLVQGVLTRDVGAAPELCALSITPAPDGAPELDPSAFGADPALRAALGAVRLSISHSGAQAFCALGPAGVAVGADIETVAARSAAFPGDFFTAGERARVAAAPAELRDTMVTAIWSAKEAVLKALRLGLTVDTRMVECPLGLPADGPEAAGWMPFTASCHPSLGGPPAGLRCWWRRHDTVVLSLAAAW